MMPQQGRLKYFRNKLERSLKKLGLWGALKVGLLMAGRVVRDGMPHYLRFKRIEQEFDRKHNVNTGFLIRNEKLDVARTELSNDYQPTPVLALKAILNDLRIACSDFVFIDLGSGTGRALLIASELPFKKIIGVEFSPNLHRIAERNVMNFKSDRQQCRDIELVCSDVLEYQVPAEDTVFYLFNPFLKPIVEKVLETIQASLQDHPRAILIIYYNPVHDELLEATPFLKKVGSVDARLGFHASTIYRA
jgi:SAM-dependent methyltransferase